MTHGRRGEVKRLKEQLATLQQKLEWYVLTPESVKTTLQRWL